MGEKRILTARKVEAGIAATRRGDSEATIRESRGRGRGSLMLRIKPSAASAPHWYFAYTVERVMRLAPIGPYGDGPDEYTLERARIRCAELDALRARVPLGDLQAHFDEIDRIERAKAASAAPLRAQGIAPGSLAALMSAYVDALQARGKDGSAKDVRRLVNLHVVEAFPDYANAPATGLTRRQAVEIVRKLVEAGKGRTAAKVRAFLRAAYALAQRAEADPAAPSAMLGFAIESNPIADVAALPQFNRTSEHALTEPELRALMKRLDASDTPSAIVLRLSLLLGGQRFNQILRARVADFDEAAGTLTLYDPKGRRATPRAHVLPLRGNALALVKARAKIARALPSEWIFPAANGEPATTTTVSKYLQTVRAAMVTAKESRDFELADLRRTCETLMASIGIAKDTRAQIQSHGLGGVQARHYDRYDYLAEKTAALDAWARWLTTAPPANVVRLEKKRRARGNA